MKHLQKGRKLSRVKNQREALLRTLAGSLILHEKIETTEAKAKELRPYVDKAIAAARKMKEPAKKMSALRALRKDLPAEAVKKLSGSLLEKFSGRTSGYTRIIKTSARSSDSARMAIIEFVD